MPEVAFILYQLAFAILTPAIICGSFADRMRLLPMLAFMTLWHLLVQKYLLTSTKVLALNAAAANARLHDALALAGNKGNAY